MASATPDLQLPSWSWGITVLWLVPNYSTAWGTEAHVCEQPAQSCYLAVVQPGVELATAWSQIEHAYYLPAIHCL